MPDKASPNEPNFTTLSGTPVQRAYTLADLGGFDTARELGAPGEFPYTRGIHKTMYRGGLWTMRQFSGFENEHAGAVLGKPSYLFPSNPPASGAIIERAPSRCSTPASPARLSSAATTALPPTASASCSASPPRSRRPRPSPWWSTGRGGIDDIRNWLSPPTETPAGRRSRTPAGFRAAGRAGAVSVQRARLKEDPIVASQRRSSGPGLR